MKSEGHLVVLSSMSPVIMGNMFVTCIFGQMQLKLQYAFFGHSTVVTP